MSDLHFVAGEFRRLASTARDVADAVRQARPDGGASAFASAMPGAELTDETWIITLIPSTLLIGTSSLPKKTMVSSCPRSFGDLALGA